MGAIWGCNYEQCRVPFSLPICGDSPQMGKHNCTRHGLALYPSEPSRKLPLLRAGAAKGYTIVCALMTITLALLVFLMRYRYILVSTCFLITYVPNTKAQYNSETTTKDKWNTAVSRRKRRWKMWQTGRRISFPVASARDRRVVYDSPMTSCVYGLFGYDVIS